MNIRNNINTSDNQVYYPPEYDITWEYFKVNIPNEKAQYLDKIGAEGWELVQCLLIPDGSQIFNKNYEYQYIFKRPVKTLKS